MLSHTKRYMIITKTWNPNNYITNNFHKASTSYDEFDTIDEVNEFIALIMEMYKDVSTPTGTYQKKFTTYNIPDGSYFWGYVALDFDEEKIVTAGGDGDPKFSAHKLVQNCKEQWEYMDLHFRKTSEIPDNYKWDDGEYNGWLQYRWGDGKNAITNTNYNVRQNITADYLMQIDKYNSSFFQAKAIEKYKEDKRNEKKRQKRKSFYKPYVEEECEFDNSDLIQEQIDTDIAAEESKIMFDETVW